MKPGDLSRALRASFWPKLKSVGFEVRTDRAAWRYVDDSVDVIDVWSVGANADACGCPSVSFSAMAGSIPSFMPPPPAWSVKNGQARPRYPDCQLKIQLAKTLSQPWFIPFAASPKPTTPLSFLQHRRGLQSVLRSDRHDRPDIWFVKDDGSNLDEVIADLWHVTETIGIPVLDRLHDPCEVIDMVLDRTLVSDPQSMFATDILDAARRICRPAPGSLGLDGAEINETLPATEGFRRNACLNLLRSVRSGHRPIQSSATDFYDNALPPEEDRSQCWKSSRPSSA